MGATPGNSKKIEVMTERPKNPSLKEIPFPMEREGHDKAAKKNVPDSVNSLAQLLAERAKNIFDFKKEEPVVKEPGFLRDVFVAKQEGIRNRLALIQRIQREHPELIEVAA